VRLSGTENRHTAVRATKKCHPVCKVEMSLRWLGRPAFRGCWHACDGRDRGGAFFAIWRRRSSIASPERVLEAI
jgi:hypothetical protein